jgi:type IV secretory pathway VirB9-like protein
MNSTSRLKGLLAFALVAASLTLTHSPLRAGEVLFRHGYAEMIADPEEILDVRMKVGYKTLLLFPSDERIVRVEVGIRGSVLDVKYGMNWVALRPSEEKIATSLDVATDKGRVYSFNLAEGEPKPFHRKIVVLRPDMDLDADGGPSLASAPAPIPGMTYPGAAGPPRPAVPQAGAATSMVKTTGGRTVAVDDLGGGPAAPVDPKVGPQGRNVPGLDLLRKLDSNYEIKNGNPKLFAVDKVYNDGERTFVRFKSRLNEAPLFYRVNNGKREILAYRLETAQDSRDSDLFIIPRLFDQATVKVGEAETHIIWKVTK